MCIYMHTRNTESSIKSQYPAIFNQNYEKMKVEIEDDASSDNTPMVLEYLAKANFTRKIKIVQNEEKKGLLKGFKRFIS